MPFSIGDLVTILIVLVILVVFRQIDRGNRSLEKMKRFGDKIIENLAAVVEEKTRQVKDLSVELAANLKTGGEILQRVKAVEGGLEKKAGDVEGIQKRLTEYDGALQELVAMSERVDQNLKRIRDESEYVDQVNRRIRDSASQLAKVEADIPTLQAGFVAQNGAQMDALKAQVLEALDGKARELAGAVKESEKKVLDFASYVSRLEVKAGELERERLDNLAREMDRMQTDLEARKNAVTGELSSEIARLSGEAESGLSVQRKQLEEAARRGLQLEDEVFSRLKESMQKDEAAFHEVVDAFEVRVRDYETDLEYRFQKLEAVQADVPAMEKSLRESLEKADVGLREDITRLAAEASRLWKQETVRAADEEARVQAGIDALSKQLDELKSKAYQDVSEKLQVFEDEFFSDLRKRSSAMQEKVQAWQLEVGTRLEGMKAEFSAERERIEKQYTEGLRGGLDGMRRTTAEESSKVEKQVADFQEAVRERIATTEQSIAVLGETLKQETEHVRKDSEALFAKESLALRDSVEAQARKMGREIDGNLRDLAGQLDSGRKELSAMAEGVRAEASVWQSRAQTQLQEAESLLTDRLATLRTNTESTIGNIRDDFTAQKEELLVATNEERLALRNEITELGDRIEAFAQELAKTTEGTLEGFHKETEAFQLDFQRKMRDFHTEVENRIKDYKGLLSENRDKGEAMQQKLFGKIEESYRLLSVNLNEIDKRVKNFLSQTKLFERADVLKVGLEGAIEEMKKDTAHLAAERTEIKEIEAQVMKTRKLSEEVSGKLSRFMAEKRRIDEMEGDFKKLLSLSRDVDAKLESIGASNDTLQQVQARIREFEELGKVVENGYERLEKKREIVGVTAEGVDKNFQRLETLEKGLLGSGKDLDGLAQRLRSLQGDVENLAVHKKDADSALETAGKLGTLLGELEERMGRFQNAREWLARTETRFETISKQAQEQVRLLETIVKSETQKEKGERGAPPMDKRDTVIKLSHQGWSVQEISRVTQLSRGEVELILEMAPKT